MSEIPHGAILLPLLAAILHPPLAWLFQRGDRAGIPMAVTVGVSNLATGLIFLSYLRPDWASAWSLLDALAILNGVFFFLGQWFSVRAVKAGDLVVHSSALGIKLLLVAGLSLAIGLETGSLSLVLAVLLAAYAIFLLAGGNLEGWKEHRATLGWTVVGTIFFGLSDTLTSWQASSLGIARWLIIMMASSGVCALVLLAKEAESFKVIGKNAKSLRILAGLAVLMGLQAVLINTAFSVYKEPTVSNVVFATRGLLAIPFLMLLHRKWKGVVGWKTAIGSALMLLALVLAV